MHVKDDWSVPRISWSTTKPQSSTAAKFATTRHQRSGCHCLASETLLHAPPPTGTGVFSRLQFPLSPIKTGPICNRQQFAGASSQKTTCGRSSRSGNKWSDKMSNPNKLGTASRTKWSQWYFQLQPFHAIGRLRTTFSSPTASGQSFRSVNDRRRRPQGKRQEKSISERRVTIIISTIKIATNSAL